MHKIRRAALFGAACLAANVAAIVPVPAANKVPRIESVVITGSDGNYTAVITGKRFGAAPDGIPCNACSPEQLQLVIQQTQPQQQSINVTDWSDNSITVTGIAAVRDDSMRIAIYNQRLGAVDAWGGKVGRQGDKPRIHSIVVSGSGKDTTITITGEGFGPAPAQVGQNTDSPYFVFTDYNATQPFTDGFPWNAAFCGANDCNGVTMGYASWSDTQIVMQGFGDEYGNEWQVNPGDAFCVGVWPSSGTSNGTTGGSFKCRRIPSP